MSNYDLSNLTSEQAHVISDALEFYSRIRTGQIVELVRMFRYTSLATCKPTPANLNKAEELLREAKQLLFPELPTDASYGIREAPDQRARISYDIHQVIRHRLAWDEDPVAPGAFRSVNHDEPWACTKMPLPKMEKKA